MTCIRGQMPVLPAAPIRPSRTSCVCIFIAPWKSPPGPRPGSRPGRRCFSPAERPATPSCIKDGNACVAGAGRPSAAQCAVLGRGTERSSSSVSCRVLFRLFPALPCSHLPLSPSRLPPASCIPRAAACQGSPNQWNRQTGLVRFRFGPVSNRPKYKIQI